MLETIGLLPKASGLMRWCRAWEGSSSPLAPFRLQPHTSPDLYFWTSRVGVDRMLLGSGSAGLSRPCARAVTLRFGHRSLTGDGAAARAEAAVCDFEARRDKAPSARGPVGRGRAVLPAVCAPAVGDPHRRGHACSGWRTDFGRGRLATRAPVWGAVSSARGSRNSRWAGAYSCRLSRTGFRAHFRTRKAGRTESAPTLHWSGDSVRVVRLGATLPSPAPPVR